MSRNAQLTQPYPMVVHDVFGLTYPIIYPNPGIGELVKGELWEVDSLKTIDKLEHHPHYYKRELLPIRFGDHGEETEAWVYLFASPLKFLSSF